MAITSEQAEWLLEKARALQPRAHGPARSVLKIATDLGIEVWLRGCQATEKPSGQLEYHTLPRVVVSLRSNKLFSHRMSLHDERLLGTRGRFTLAHELGHWLVFKHFGTEPVSDKAEYWRDEQVINRFAGHLLLPEWQVDDWLKQLSRDQGIHIQHIFKWAKESGLSREAIASRISERQNGTGFLSLVPVEGLRTHFPDLEVDHSAGTGLPGRSAKIRNERLFRKLSSSASGEGILQEFSFGKKPRSAGDFFVSWATSRRRVSAGDAVQTNYWSSWSRFPFARSPQTDDLLSFVQA